MPYTKENSLSPSRRQWSISPPPEASKGHHRPPPTKKPKLKEAEIQRLQLEKLLDNPDKPVAMPTGVVEKKMKPPPEMMKNVQGSASGAGSGEFHVYKASRKREYERIKMMETKARAEQEQREFQERQAARESLADAKTAKNRAKRLKRKAGRKGDGPSNGTGSGEAGGSSSTGGGLKRKLDGGAPSLLELHEQQQAQVQGQGQRQDGSDSEGDEDQSGRGGVVTAATGMDGSRTSAVQNSVTQLVEPPKVVEEVKVVIHDDD